MSKYPTSIDNQTTLLNPVDGSSTKSLATTTIALVLSGDTTINVASTAAGFASAYGVLSIEDELVIYTGKTATSFTGCIRGALGSSAIGHAAGVAVKALNCAGYITALQAAVIATQTQIGVTGAFNFAATSHSHDASEIVSGEVAVARLGTGSPSSSTFLRGDGTWAATTPTFANQTANFVFAGPTTGSAAAPTFRALAAADIPNLAASVITSGVIAVARLGTGTPSSANFLRGDGAWTAVGGGGTWGSIAGALSDQSDLNTALGGKQATISGAPGAWPSTFAPSAHASSHRNGGSDEIATATATANSIPKAGSGGTLDPGWIPTLNQNTSGSAASLGGQYIDWSASSGGASIANKPAIPTASSYTPAVDGTGAAGSSANYARADHVHPTDTSRQAAISGAPGSWPSTFAPSAHASTHASAGGDALSLDASQVTTGTMAIARLGSGTATGAKFLRDDSTWAVPNGGSGTVSSVGLSVPAFLSVSGSPITGSGTLAVALADENANYVMAGPTSGGAATPTFRALVAGDIPNLPASKIASGQIAVAQLGTGTPDGTRFLRDDGAWVVPSSVGAGTVTSVAMSVPAFLSVSGSPITVSGTFAVTLANETANYVFAGPTTGSAAAPTFRALLAADIPDLSAAYAAASHTHAASAIVSGQIAVAQFGTGSPSSSNFLRGDGTWAAISGGSVPSDVDKTGTYASRPAASTAGVLYLPSDSYFAFRDTGSAWAAWGPVSKLTQPPALSNWTALNQGSATIEDYRGGIRIVLGASLATGMRAIYKAAPPTPYTITIGFTGVHNNVDGAHIFAGWRSSSGGQLAIIRYRREANPTIRSSKYTSATVYSADYNSNNYPTLSSGAMLWYQLADDGTNRTVSVSNDGLNWVLIHSVGRTDFMTGDQIVFGTDTNGGGLGGCAVLMSYLEA